MGLLSIYEVSNDRNYLEDAARLESMSWADGDWKERSVKRRR